MMPVGTGPYKFISDDGKLIKLSANEAWWNASKDKKKTPLINEIVIKIYKNGSENLSALQDKEIDVAFADSLSSSRYNGNYNITIKKYPTRNYDYITFNLNRPLTADKSVRQAVAYAIDRKNIIENVIPGGATISDLPILPDSWLYDSDVIYFDHNTEKAKQILSQNGWNNSNGVLYKNLNGAVRGLTLELLVNSENSTRLKFAEEIKSQLAEAGIIVNIKSLPFDQEYNLIKAKTFDMAITGVTLTSIPDITFSYASSEIQTGRNLAGYSNPQVDSILKDMSIENDSKKKKTLFSSLRTILDDEVPYTGLFFYNNAVLYNKKIRGVTNPYYNNKYYDLPGWYVIG
jgi:peptide/nickel transport system substrate-binding protein